MPPFPENTVTHFTGLAEAIVSKKAAMTKPLAKIQGRNEPHAERRYPL